MPTGVLDGNARPATNGSGRWSSSPSPMSWRRSRTSWPEGCPMPPPSRAEPAAPIRERAPAKLNLDLLVIGRRADGYHELDSLVVFAADVADELVVAPDPAGLRLEVDGPFAAELPGDGSNIIVRAGRLLA